MDRFRAIFAIVEEWRCKCRSSSVSFQLTRAPHEVLLLPFSFACLSGLSCLHAGDWPNYRGPHYNGISDEKNWQAQFPASGPKVLWKASVGIGFSSFSVADGRVYTTGNEENTDTVFCFDAVTGKQLWGQSYPSDLGDKFFEGGTTSTPTVDGGHVYQLSRWGDAFCYDAATGKVIWSENVQKLTGAKIPDWGYGGSVLVLGKLAILNVGGAGLALDKLTGKIVWKSDVENAGYTTPFPVTKGGLTMAVFGTGKKYLAVDVTNGSKIWEFPWPTRYEVNASAPIVSGDTVFISAGYNHGSALLNVNGSTPTVVWQNKDLRNMFSSSVLIDGHLYGIDNDQNTRASLRCVDLATGTVKWKDEGVGFGSLMAADGKLIVLTAKGELITAKASPEKLDVISRAKVLDGKCWSAPVLANGRIYCRDAAGDVVCLDASKGG